MRIEVRAQGQCLECIIHPYPTLASPRPRGGLRGNVTKFSKDSRLRLMKLTAKLSSRKIRATGCKPVFLTLTYPSLQENYQEAKRDLKVFIQRLRRLHGNLSGVWKMELQKRGAIHFHMMLFGLPYTPVQDLQQAWNEVTQQQSKNSLDLEIIRTVNGVIYYVSKYICKEEDTRFEQQISQEPTVGLSMPHNGPSQEPTSTGRWWGIINRACLPLGDVSRFYADLDDIDFREWVSSLRERYATWFHSFTVFSKRVYAYVWRLRQAVRMRLPHYLEKWQRQRQGARHQCHVEAIKWGLPRWLTAQIKDAAYVRKMEHENPGFNFGWHWQGKVRTGKLIKVPDVPVERKTPQQLALFSLSDLSQF